MKFDKYASDIDDDSDNERSYIDDWCDAVTKCASGLFNDISFFLVNFVKMTLMTLLGSLFYLPKVFHSYNNLKMFTLIAQFGFPPGVFLTYIDIIAFIFDPTRTYTYHQYVGIFMLSIIPYMIYCIYSLTCMKYGWLHIGTIYTITLLSLQLFMYVISHNDYMASNMRLYYGSRLPDGAYNETDN